MSIREPYDHADPLGLDAAQETVLRVLGLAQDAPTGRHILREVADGGGARHERLISFDLEDPNGGVLHYTITITCDDEAGLMKLFKAMTRRLVCDTRPIIPEGSEDRLKWVFSNPDLPKSANELEECLTDKRRMRRIIESAQYRYFVRNYESIINALDEQCRGRRDR